MEDRIVCDKCGSEFSLKDLKRTKGKCPKCGDVLPILKYCHVVPEKHFWKLYSNAPLSIRIYSILWGWHISLLTGIYGFVFGFGWRPGVGDSSLFQCAMDVWFWLWVLLWVLSLFVRPLFFASVKGRWLSPVVAFVILFLSALLIRFSDTPPVVVGVWICSVMEKLVFVCIWVLIPLIGLCSIPLIFKSARRWRAKCKEEELAYSIAKESGADLSSVSGHVYKNKPLAIGIAVVIIGLCILFTTRAEFARGEEGRREKREWSERWIDKTIERTLGKWKRLGVDWFLANPKCHLSATNDMYFTMARLEYGFARSVEAMEILNCGVEESKVKDEDKGRVESVKAEFALYARVFAEAKGIIQDRVQLNKGDPDGALRKDFGTEDLKVIDEKLDAEMEAYLERYVEIFKGWAPRHTQTGDDKETP